MRQEISFPCNVLAMYFLHLMISCHRESIGISVMPNIKVRDAEIFQTKVEKKKSAFKA